MTGMIGGYGTEEARAWAGRGLVRLLEVTARQPDQDGIRK
jgi:hypothetical protein